MDARTDAFAGPNSAKTPSDKRGDCVRIRDVAQLKIDVLECQSIIEYGGAFIGTTSSHFMLSIFTSFETV
jgi:hypothetical protein